VKACLEGEINPMAPASVLRTHHDTTVYLDTNSASLLSLNLHQLSDNEAQVVV